MRTRLAGALVRGLLAAITAGVLAGVTACGSVAAPSAGHAHPASGSAVPSVTVPLCANAAHLDRMVMASVSPGLVMGPAREALPVGVLISDPTRVRAIAAALCALPAMTPTHMRCPVIHSEAYRLTFFAAGRAFPPVVAVASGCRRSVTGLGPARMMSGRFWFSLRKKLGISGTGVLASTPPPPAEP